MSKLVGPFQGNIKTPPGTHDNANYDHFELDTLNKPFDGDCLGEAFYAKADSLKPGPAAMTSPMGTAIPGIGHPVK